MQHVHATHVLGAVHKVHVCTKEGRGLIPKGRGSKHPDFDAYIFYGRPLTPSQTI
jgi:hypothetical protein